jgi:TolA-binding protein
VKYDDIIEIAKKQDCGPTPGPDFMTLMAASTAAKAAAGKSALTWLWTAIAGVGVAGGITYAVVAGGGDSPPDVEPPVAAAPQPSLAGKPAPAPKSVAVEPADVEANDDVTPEEPQAADEPQARPASPRLEKRLDAEALYRRAEQHMAAGKLTAARRDLRTLVRRFPESEQHATAMLDLARLQGRLGQHQRAACTYRRFLDRHGGHVLATDANKALAGLEGKPGVDLARCR